MARRYHKETIFGKECRFQSLTAAEGMQSEELPTKIEIMTRLTLLSLVDEEGTTLFAPNDEGAEEFITEFCEDDWGIAQAIMVAATNWVVPDKKKEALRN